MGMFRAAIVTVVCVLVLVDGQLYKRNSDCQALANCQLSITRHVDDSTDPPSFFGGDLNRFCTDLETAKRCSEQVKSACSSDEVIARVERLHTNADYLCSDEGRAETLAVEQSPCNTDSNKFEEARNDMQTCRNKFQSDMRRLTAVLSVTVGSEFRHPHKNDVCPLVNIYVECSIAAAVKVCGQVFERHVRKTLHQEDKYEYGCFQHYERKRMVLWG